MSTVSATPAVPARLRTRVKLCGLKTAADVQQAVSNGADAVGFVFYPPSPRAVSIPQAAGLARGLPPWISPTGLFVNPQPDEVLQAIAAIPGLVLQFHADEDDAFCAQFDRPFIKAVRMQAGTNLVEFRNRFPSASALLVDAFVEGYGGGGHTFDWGWLPAPGQLDCPLILSGGLSADNVGEAIRRVSPYAVDVSSGIEVSRGVKCPQRMLAFCRAVSAADCAADAGM